MHWAAMTAVKFSAIIETGAALALKVRKKAPVLPMRHAVGYNALEVGEDRLHAYRLFRW